MVLHEDRALLSRNRRKNGGMLKSSGDVLDNDASSKERERERDNKIHSYVTVSNAEVTYVPARFGIMKLMLEKYNERTSFRRAPGHLARLAKACHRIENGFTSL